MRNVLYLSLCSILIVAVGSAAAHDVDHPGTTGVIGVDAEQLTPDFWIARAPQADALVLDREAIAARNAHLVEVDPTLHDLKALPSTLPRAQVRGWIEELASPPTKPLYDEHGKRIPQVTLDAILAARHLDAIIPEVTPRYGLVVHRASLRSFPTDQRAYSDADDHDIDRFQESALFPGTPVVVVHASADGQWRFVVSARYAAWIAQDAVAEGPKARVFAYADAPAYRLVVGANATTVYTPEHPASSQLQLDMGTRTPLLADWPPSRPVDGQHPYTAHVIELPRRRADGRLDFVPALLPKSADTAAAPLPFTRAVLLRQAFKFLGERYGWGHDYDARDCSGFVSDVYHSVGIEMPRNTRDQAKSAGLDHTSFDANDTAAARLAAVRSLAPGDLVYIPGHVMMAIGTLDGEPYVIHDTTGISWRNAEGRIERTALNAVSVSPLLPLQFNDRETYVDRMTSIVRFRPDPLKDAPHTP